MFQHSDFNPRTCVRCDLQSQIALYLILYFNPRTCVRCDHPTMSFVKGTVEFQSTHLREVRRLELKVSISDLHSFQSTHLREVRHLCSSYLTTIVMYFNPRTCVRCDRNILIKQNILSTFTISINKIFK